jgi:RNA polymerase sigma factor (sigma-70 family)
MSGESCDFPAQTHRRAIGFQLCARTVPAKKEPLIATRKSLIARLSNWEDNSRWQEFFDTYWQLIYSVARRAGLHDDEAQEVVQETCISVAKNVEKYDAKAGSFKSWLLQMSRWRIMDQFRKRPKNRHISRDDDTRMTATLDRIPGEGETRFEDMWEEEWQRRALDAALTKMKKKVDAKHYQIFDCTVIKGWSAAETAKNLDTNIAQVYLVKHRLKAMLKKELKVLEE